MNLIAGNPLFWQQVSRRLSSECVEFLLDVDHSLAEFLGQFLLAVHLLNLLKLFGELFALGDQGITEFARLFEASLRFLKMSG